VRKENPHVSIPSAPILIRQVARPAPVERPW
jgi:hypothetical protein